MEQSHFTQSRNKLYFLNNLEEELFGKKSLYEPSTDENNIVRISKYMSLENALSLLDTQELYLANPKVWPDSFESLFIKAEYEIFEQEIQKQKHFNDLLPNSQYLYCTCFTRCFQSDAQWKMYNNNEIAIMMDFDAKKLFQELANYHSNLYIGKVQYIEGGWQAVRELDEKTRLFILDKNAPQHLETMLSLMLRKRINYKYEEEIRLMHLRKPIINDACKKNKSKLGINIKIPNIKDCITQIRIDPRLGTRTTEAIKEILRQRYPGTISKSGMNFNATFNTPIKLYNI